MTCAKCIFWKRRTGTTGTCWQMADQYPAPIATTHESDTCGQWTAKVTR